MADILIIDDEENLAYSIQLALKRAGHQPRVAVTADAGLAQIDDCIPDLALVDIQLPDVGGLDLMARFRQRGLDFPVIVITAFGTMDSAVAAMQQGAVDYIQKPLSMDELTLAVDRCLEYRAMRNQLDAYRQAQRRESDETIVIAECAPMRQVLALADRIAALPDADGGELATVLLLGETGTGKEVIARYIHHHSQTADKPFVQVNCTAIPENLFESELFGYEAGAFTSAKSAKKGLLEMAHEGTLFLDEIGDMPLATQAKLLVAIESGRFRRLGGTTERQVRVRVMAATNSDLQSKVDAGEFRADLFYRLKVFCLELPPLRRRGEDLFLLADFFLNEFCRKFHRAPMELPPDTKEAMQRYRWPGNVRELANVLQRAVLVANRGRIDPGTLGLDPTDRPATSQAPGDDAWIDFASGRYTLSAVERRLIDSAMRQTGGNISEAARLLGLTRGALRHRLEKQELER